MSGRETIAFLEVTIYKSVSSGHKIKCRIDTSMIKVHPAFFCLKLSETQNIIIYNESHQQ
jgi:hypothetical protein